MRVCAVQLLLTINYLYIMKTNKGLTNNNFHAIKAVFQVESVVTRIIDGKEKVMFTILTTKSISR